MRAQAATTTATILVTDIVGSTRLRVELGEARADALRRVHDRALSIAASEHRGRVVKGLGDGVLVLFEGAADAISAAIAMQQAVRQHAVTDALDLAIRIGVSAGDVSLEDDDCFGTPVVEASRLCAAADSGQVLVADVVRVLARGRGHHELNAVGALDLKGLPDPVAVWSVGWEHDDHAASSVPYLGRARELAVLTDDLDRVA